MRKALIFILMAIMTGCVRHSLESITIKGSDTEVNLVLELAEAYMATDSTVSISVTGGGSGVGIAGLLNKKIDIANSSRELNPYEQRLAAQRSVSIIPYVFAADALAIVCHPSIPVDSLLLSDLGRIFSGEVRDWQELGAGPGAISLYGRQSNSGTFSYFRERVLGKDYAAELKQMNGNAQILEAVKADPHAIGYVGFGYLTDNSGALRPGIKVIKLASEPGKPGVSPLDRVAIRDGLYPLTRPLYQFTDGERAGSIHAFFEFEKSAAGQRIIIENGYLPASEAGLAYNSGK